jgi:hypothetical protein
MAFANLMGNLDEFPGLALEAIVYEFIACRLANQANVADAKKREAN